jgi:hypothetical protein
MDCPTPAHGHLDPRQQPPLLGSKKTKMIENKCHYFGLTPLQGFGHPQIAANYTPTWDGVFIDPTIQEENRARNCTRLAGERYGGFLGLFGRPLGDRIPTYYDNP